MVRLLKLIIRFCFQDFVDGTVWGAFCYNRNLEKYRKTRWFVPAILCFGCQVVLTKLLFLDLDISWF